MKILFIALDINLGNLTGDVIHTRELATSLAKQGNEVFLIVAQVDKPDVSWAKGIPNLHLYFNKNKGIFKSFSTVIFCRKIAKKHGVQVIYERRTSPKIGYALNKTLKIPFIVEVNALVEEEIPLLRKEKKSPAVKRFKRVFRRRFFRKAERIVTVTESIKNAIQKDYDLNEERVVVISNGANTDMFRPMNQDSCRRDLGFEGKEKYLCFVGSLEAWQGVRHIIEAMPLILEGEPKAKLLIIGDGQQKKTLMEKTRELKLEERVVFTGWVEYQDVPKYINASDICVAPLSKGREKSGSSAIKIYEYLACAKPVIAFEVPDLGFLDERGCGIIVQRDNVPKLTEACLHLLGNDELRKNMGDKGRRVVVENYSWTNTAKKISELLENVF